MTRARAKGIGPRPAALLGAAAAGAAIFWAAGCGGGGGGGGGCNSNDDCTSGRVCDPDTGRCVAPADSGPPPPDGSTYLDGGPDASSPPDGAPPSDAAADSGTDAAPDAGGSIVTFCDGQPGQCTTGQVCFQAIISCGSNDGFCVDTNAGTCGGMIGQLCPTDLYCVVEHWQCNGADLTGVCVSADQYAEICANQPDLWTCP